MIFLAIFAPFIAPYPPIGMDIPSMLKPPSVDHLFGTDEFGRDVLSRVIFGARISLRVGLSVAIATGIVGIGVGLLAGYFRRLDNPIMRFLDAMMAIPSLLLALAIVSIVGPSEGSAVAALTITYTPRTARVIRGAVLSIKEQYYVESAIALGAGTFRIMIQHILVNCIGPVIVQQSFIFAYAVLAEAMLSFLGVGPPPPAPSWGNIISEARGSMRIAPWIMFFPGIAISITVLGINMLGDGLRDVLDPKSRVQGK
jgi:peptide/nickel transport system permease protein